MRWQIRAGLGRLGEKKSSEFLYAFRTILVEKNIDDPKLCRAP